MQVNSIFNSLLESSKFKHIKIITNLIFGNFELAQQQKLPWETRLNQMLGANWDDLLSPFSWRGSSPWFRGEGGSLRGDLASVCCSARTRSARENSSSPPSTEKGIGEFYRMRIQRQLSQIMPSFAPHFAKLFLQNCAIFGYKFTQEVY